MFYGEGYYRRVVPAASHQSVAGERLGVDVPDAAVEVVVVDVAVEVVVEVIVVVVVVVVVAVFISVCVCFRLLFVFFHTLRIRKVYNISNVSLE